MRALLFLALALTGGCASNYEYRGCTHEPSSGATPGFCYCPPGEGCSLTCHDDAAYTLSCADRNTDCSLVGGDGATLLCQGAHACTATVGANAMVACQGTRKCDAVVGAGAEVRCELATACEVNCRGACSVDCGSGVCRVTCGAPESCAVTCDKSGMLPALCPDGMTKVCGQGC